MNLTFKEFSGTYVSHVQGILPNFTIFYFYYAIRPGNWGRSKHSPNNKFYQIKKEKIFLVFCFWNICLTHICIRRVGSEMAKAYDIAQSKLRVWNCTKKGQKPSINRMKQKYKKIAELWKISTRKACTSCIFFHLCVGYFFKYTRLFLLVTGVKKIRGCKNRRRWPLHHHGPI